MPEKSLRHVVVCSLERWDEVWRRNQFFVDHLVTSDAGVRVLFVEPPADPLHDLLSRRVPSVPRLRAIQRDRRLIALRPFKPFPRRLGSWTDTILLNQVAAAARALGFRQPVLWVNDVSYAPLIESSGWPSVYDVTDDWLLAPFPPREIERLRRLDRLATSSATQVVVCSPALETTRGATRDVHLIRNGVDVDHFASPRDRPPDLPQSPTAVYVGTLHESRLDVDLVRELAAESPSLNVVLVGPIALSDDARDSLELLPNVSLLGAKDYRVVPAYLQHADVLIVPHIVSPFTDSLDPIKAYEYAAVGKPTVATAVAGFREHPDRFRLVARCEFAAAVTETRWAEPAVPQAIRSWRGQAIEFQAVLQRALEGRPD